MCTRKDAQRENAAKKECPRIGWQQPLRLGIRHHGMWLRRVIVRDGVKEARSGGGEAATKFSLRT